MPVKAGAAVLSLGSAIAVPAAAAMLRPEDVSAEVLRHVLANARKRFNVHAAVITVPATFTIRQREATENAAHLAGLKVRLLP